MARCVLSVCHVVFCVVSVHDPRERLSDIMICVCRTKQTARASDGNAPRRSLTGAARDTHIDSHVILRDHTAVDASVYS